LIRVELLPAPPLGRVDDHGLVRLPYQEVMDELLDASRSRREVVRDQECAAHRSPRAKARAAAIRSTTDGWLANMTYSRRGGSTSARLVVASLCSIRSTVDGSFVSTSACASARASVRRGSSLRKGAAHRPARTAS